MTPGQAHEKIQKSGFALRSLTRATNGRIWFAEAIDADGNVIEGRGDTDELACCNLIVRANAAAKRRAA
jgi:hypothetical protein